jgi:hypothetical protein
MAYTVSIYPGSKAVKHGNKRVTYCDVTFTGSHAAGGETLTARDFALNTIQFVSGVVTEAAGQTAGLPVTYNRSTGKLQMYEAAAAGSPGAEKGAEAYAATTVGHLKVEGY